MYSQQLAFPGINLYSYLNTWYRLSLHGERKKKQKKERKKKKTADVCDTWKIKGFQSNKGNAQKVWQTVALLQYFL